MSKKQRHQFEVPEERQHDPITVPVNPVTGHPIGTDTEVVRPPITIEVRRIDPLVTEHVLEGVSMTPEPQSTKVLERTQVKPMVAQQPAKVVNFEQRVYRCVYDEAATARKVTIGERDPDVFCQVCGNRMVREG